MTLLEGNPMQSKKSMTPGQKTTITITNRDAHSALTALDALAKERGFPNTDTILHVGATMRALRTVREEYGDAQQMLLSQYAKRDSSGKIIATGLQQVEWTDPIAYMEEIKKLHRIMCEVTIYPIAMAVLGEGTKRDKPCEKCKQATGLPEPEHLALLVELGIIVGD